jgi:hypothetical protein
MITGPAKKEPVCENCTTMAPLEPGCQVCEIEAHEEDLH